MKKTNWSAVEPAGQGGGSMLPAGGYVVKITDVEDNPDKEFLTITFDIAEGEYAGHFSDDFARQNPYIHQFRRYYSDKAENFFAQFLECLQFSNPSFTIAEWEQNCNERELVGLELGVVFQLEHYTNSKGDDKKRLNAEKFYAAQDIRNGDFSELPDKDSRETVVAAPEASGDAYGASIPF